MAFATCVNTRLHGEAPNIQSARLSFQSSEPRIGSPHLLTRKDMLLLPLLGPRGKDTLTGGRG
jgi:hypothetical protein